MSLTAGVGSFSVSANNAQLTYRRIEVESAQLSTGFNLAYRLIDGYPTFVGAEGGLSNTAPTPSHQEHDLIVVFAANFDNDTIPVIPANNGWTNAYQNSVTGQQGWIIAYKFAKSNTETVGAWLTADRVLVAVYRNARGLVGTAQESIGALANIITYPAADNDVVGTAGTRLLHIAISVPSNDAGSTPTGLTTRIGTGSLAGSTAPSIALHDQEVSPAGNYPTFTNSIGGVGTTVGITLGIGYGTPPLIAETTSFSTSISGRVLPGTLLVDSKGYRAELGQVLTSYQSFFTCNGGSFALSGSSLDTHLGFYLQAEAGDFDYSLTDAFLKRALLFFPQQGSFLKAWSSIDLPKGFFATPQSGAFTSTVATTGIIHTAMLFTERIDLDAALTEGNLQRSIIESFSGTTLSFGLSQVGIRNISASPAGGGPTRKPDVEHGGSDPSYQSFLRPRFTKYNSVSKSRDLGRISNFFGTFTGEIGAESGSQTLFFKMQTIGSASLRITKNTSNRYTDKQISIGILDSNRKQVQITDQGFAFENDIVNTDDAEGAEPLPGGTYYFTVSSSQWQKIPYSVSIQAIRFKDVKGEVVLTMLPTARFSIAKLRGPALLQSATQTTIPTNAQLKRPTGAILLSNASSGALVIPSGIALGQMLPSGRLKMTHKISSTATLSSVNEATLSSQPPQYGGGYGP